MSNVEILSRIKLKRDTSANWTNKNPVLLNGELIIIDTNTGEIRFKIGDGVKTYTELPFQDEVIRNLINENKYTLPIATEGSLGGIIIGDNLIIDENGRVSALNTDTKVTSAQNHYKPNENATQQISVESEYGIGVVTGVNLDDAHHVVSLRSATIPNTDTEVNALSENPVSSRAVANYVEDVINNLPSMTEVPTKLSQLENDQGFITANEDKNTTYTITKEGSSLLLTGSDGSSVQVDGLGKDYADATTTASGLMSAADKIKLNGIAEGANKYVLPSAGSSLGGVKTGGDVTITDGTITVNDDSHAHVIANIDGLQDALNTKAALASPALTGTPTAPTPGADTNSTQIATTAFVNTVVNNKIAAADAMIYKGTIGSSGATVTALPATHKTGYTYKVITAGSYAGVYCEVGDMIICLTDGTSANNAHWTVVQNNIDGAVTGPASSTDAHVAVFNGATGKVIKDSGFTIGKSVPSDAKFTDTTYSAATTSVAGLMSAADKSKLDGITSAGSATQPVYFSNGKPVATSHYLQANIRSYQGSLSSGGWAALNGLANEPSITIGYNNSAAAWNSSTYSATLVWGCSDTRGLLDCSYTSPVITFGGSSYGGATNDSPKWYMKLTGTSAATYNLDNFWKKGDSVTGAVWNDYAEYRQSDLQENEFGYVLCELGDDTLTKTSERLAPFAGIASDTWGFTQGKTETAKTPIAVAGRVLVYTYQDRDNYKPGDCVCAAPGGTVDIMTREEVRDYPDRIVGTVSCIPQYEEWGGGELADRPSVKVDGRIWIKVK